MFDRPAYFTRIGYEGSVDHSAETLRALHLAHVLTVPFENLDIHLGQPISLEPADLFRKIVVNRRCGRPSARRTVSSFTSKPMYLRFCSLATNGTLPPPMNGSSTI